MNRIKLKRNAKKNIVAVSVLTMVLLLALVTGCDRAESTKATMTVAVSIIPQETFVKAVAGDLVEVVTMIPPGASPTNYQPSPKEMNKLSEADVYFAIDVNTEVNNIVPNLGSFNAGMFIVDLAAVVDDVYPARFFGEEHEDEEEHGDEDEHEDEHDHDHDHSGRDPHIWMSPKRVIVMIKEIEKVLSVIDPANEEIYSKNAKEYIKKLEQADKEILANISNSDIDEFVIMHPSIGYFADDYNLHMEEIEESGKEASASHLESIIEFSKEHNIKVVLYQTEFDSSQAQVIADEIGGKVYGINPLSGNYIEELIKLSEAFLNDFNN